MKKINIGGRKWKKKLRKKKGKKERGFRPRSEETRGEVLVCWWGCWGSRIGEGCHWGGVVRGGGGGRSPPPPGETGEVGGIFVHHRDYTEDTGCVGVGVGGEVVSDQHLEC